MPQELYKEQANECLKDFCKFINLRHFQRVGTKGRLVKHAAIEMKTILATVGLMGLRKSLLSTYPSSFLTFPAPGDANRANKVAQLFFAYCWDTEFIDPPSRGIDGCNGYLRDARVFNSQAATTRRALRIDLGNPDKRKAGVSEFISGLNPKGKTEQQLELHIEHVLEIAVVAHMINNSRFLKRARRKLGEKLPAGGFDLATMAKLAEILKESPNLVQSVPKWFNDMKRNFFQGNAKMTIGLAQYLEERSKVQEPWIKQHAQNRDPYVRFVFQELSNSRFVKGNWGELMYSKWVPEEEKFSLKEESSDWNIQRIWLQEEDSAQGYLEEDDGHDYQGTLEEEEEEDSNDGSTDSEWTPPDSDSDLESECTSEEEYSEEEAVFTDEE
ncbi:hypothetical protein GALMADRAFT_137361 [Galerina marginata CBS 339.88]|uniref:Uncharacterized protein n=1 Tax=Galerina marginata (strain CBS 339.88) TaxID=685588 RepID=A0A067T8P1_GALM3|nr:hypothetical protein GALMADRAFT_137361 [Galerina marginata CBS 339.88]